MNDKTHNLRASRAVRMLTYDLSHSTDPLYEQLYRFIKRDILDGRLQAEEKLPSKRTLAKNHGISTITVENAYDQLISEGYVYTLPKKGYYVADISDLTKIKKVAAVSLDIQYPKATDPDFFDFSSDRADPATFPFSTWARLMRDTISFRKEEVLRNSTCGGTRILREAIADHLASFRGMYVDPDQIIIGAGTEYLYGLLIQLLGYDKLYCVENPGYQKIAQVYQSNGVRCVTADLDAQGIRVDALRDAGAQIVHISPTHHFPTGITMPVRRRYELLAWASESDDRYIIEDDYDSEFRMSGKPIPPLVTIDVSKQVIYMNTFSKSLAPTIRISYMVLPVQLANQFYRQLSFYTCTVSTFEQYTLAEFIRRGFFEKHINRMRLYYGRKRTQVIDAIERCLDKRTCTIIENDSGLHFILQFETALSDEALTAALKENGIRLRALKEYDLKDTEKNTHRFLVNYANIDTEALEEKLLLLKKILQTGTKA